MRSLRSVAAALLVFASLSAPAWAHDDLDSARSEAMSRYHRGDYAGFVARMEPVAAMSHDETDLYNLACGYSLTGRVDEALAALRALEDRGSSFNVHDSDLDNLRGRPEFNEIVKLSFYYDQINDKLDSVRDRAMDQYHEGRYDLFVQIMESVATYSKNDKDVYNLACGYALTGRTEDALAQLRILADHGSDYGVSDDSDFDSIRGDPRFKALAAKIDR